MNWKCAFFGHPWLIALYWFFKYLRQYNPMDSTNASCWTLCFGLQNDVVRSRHSHNSCKQKLSLCWPWELNLHHWLTALGAFQRNINCPLSWDFAQHRWQVLKKRYLVLYSIVGLDIEIMLQTGSVTNTGIGQTLLNISRKEGLQGWYRWANILLV